MTTALLLLRPAPTPTANVLFTSNSPSPRPSPRYDGLPEEYDDYDRWFNATTDGEDPLATAPADDPTRPLDMNDWRGAPYSYAEDLHPTAWTATQAVRVLEAHNATEPLFLKVSFHRPHSPYDPPSRVLGAVGDVAQPVYASDGWDRTAAGVCDASKVDFVDVPTPDVDSDIWCGAVGADRVEASRRAYVGSVEFVDESLGPVLDLMEAKFGGNYVAVYVSDHGDNLGDHYLWRKATPYEAAARVPFSVSWGSAAGAALGLPAASQGARLGRDRLVEMRDVLPTLLEAAGLPAAADADGASVLPLIRDSEAAVSWRQVVGLEHSLVYNDTNAWSALVGADFKYVFKAIDGSEQLFDLRADPDEAVDLAPDAAYATTLAKWRRQLGNQWVAEGRGAAWTDADGLPIPHGNILYSPHYPAQPQIAVDEGSEVWVVAFSPNGTLLATGAGDAALDLWDAATGDLVRTLTGHTDEIDALGFSPDGARIVSVSDDETVKVWDVATGECLQTLTGHTGCVEAVSWSPDGKYIASGGQDLVVKLWDTATWDCVVSIAASEEHIYGIAFHPDSTRVASGSGDNTVAEWLVPSGKPSKVYKGLSAYTIGYSPDGQWIAGGCDDSTTMVWSTSSGSQRAFLQPYGPTADGKGVSSVAFSPDSMYLATGGDDALVVQWDWMAGEKVQVWQASAEVHGVSWAPDGTRIASGADDGAVDVWEVGRRG